MARTGARAARDSFGISLPPVLICGGVVSALFFALVFWGPLDTPLLRRYCTKHPVAIASVCLFLTGVSMLLIKWGVAIYQFAVTRRASAVLQRIIAEGDEVAATQRAAWLLARWASLSDRLRYSWFGSRLTSLLELQLTRGQRSAIESDLEKLSDEDARRQHDSYSLIRIINWAMPMLGFLGTVLGISQTLGQLDTELLATQQQEAMNQLTAGLYVAFDTTAIALVLTVALMFFQFAVNRLENRLLEELDRETERPLTAFLALDELLERQTLLEPMRRMAEQLMESCLRIAEQQGAMFARALSRHEERWSAWSDNLATSFGEALASQLQQVFADHIEQLRDVQAQSSQYMDVRWKQWQTELSSTARQMHQQQLAITQQTKALEELIRQTVDLKKLEESILDSTLRLEHLKRIEEASACVAEAVAVLASSLEQAGILRGAPIRPRAAGSSASSSAPATNHRRTSAVQDKASSESSRRGKAA